VPPAPGITSVAAERNGIDAAWTAATGTASFEAQLATTADFAKPVTTQRTSSTRARFERPASGDYFVRVRGLDAIDGTPVLDIKPYLPQYDAIPGATTP